MLKRWLLASLVFGLLVFVVFIFNAAVQVSDGASPFPSIQTASAQADGEVHGGGLTEIDFATFVKGGSGWAYMTQGYGRTPYSYLYIGDWHNGIDIGARYGARILSADSGTVVATGDQDDYCPGKAFGKFVVVKDSEKDVDVMYGHLSAIDVAPGDSVTRNVTAIGAVGTTGLETGPHLHFSVFKSESFSMAPAYGCGPYPQGDDVNPIPYLESL